MYLLKLLQNYNVEGLKKIIIKKYILLILNPYSNRNPNLGVGPGSLRSGLSGLRARAEEVVCRGRMIEGRGVKGNN